MKRENNFYEKICELENIKLAHRNAKQGKLFYSDVKMVDSNLEKYSVLIQKMLIDKTYKISEYNVFKKKCGIKEREIFKLPYYPDRIIQHAIMQVMMPIWMKIFINNTYASLRGRGIHAGVNDLKKSLENKEETTYCLKIDIKKFYPSINNEILKQILRKKIKDNDLLWLLDEIIDSNIGVPIGNYLSQYFANLYLAYFDHWLKEENGVKYYFRYCDST